MIGPDRLISAEWCAALVDEVGRGEAGRARRL
jgi:hypothetical protein